MVKHFRNEATESLADDMIGAAQELEKLAAQLKRQARIIRAQGMICGDMPEKQTIELMRFHKQHDVMYVSKLAIEQLT